MLLLHFLRDGVQVPPSTRRERGWKVEPVGLILGTERRDFSSVRWEPPLRPSHRGVALPTPASPAARGWRTWLTATFARVEVGQRSRGRSRLHPRRALTSIRILKIRKKKPRLHALSEPPRAPDGLAGCRPPLPAATGCRSDSLAAQALRRPGRVQRATTATFCRRGGRDTR